MNKHAFNVGVVFGAVVGIALQFAMFMLVARLIR